MDVVHLHFDDEATVFRGVCYSDRDGQGRGAGGGKGIEHCLDATDGRTQGEIGHFVFDVQDNGQGWCGQRSVGGVNGEVDGHWWW